MRRMAIAVMAMVGMGLAGGAPAQQNSIATSAESRLAAWEQHRRMDRESPFADVRWRAVGPQMQGGRIESIAVPAGETTTFYESVESGNLWKTVNNGTTWTPISSDLTSRPAEQGNIPFGTLTTLSESSLQQGLIYAGADDGYIHLTRDDGGNWTRIDDGLPDLWVSRVEASRHQMGTVYVSLTGYREDDFSTYLYASDDFGESWRSIASNLPMEPVNVVREDPADPDILYVGTDLGVFVSVDRGGSWRSLSATVPTTPVYDLVIHPRDGEIVIGTHGRSVWVAELEAVRGWARE